MTLVAEPPVYNIYCDESCHLENDRQPIMLLGAVWCEASLTRRVSEEIRALKVKHGLAPTFEVKWVKVSKGQAAFYSDLLAYFLTSEHQLGRPAPTDADLVGRERLGNPVDSRGRHPKNERTHLGRVADKASVPDHGLTSATRARLSGGLRAVPAGRPATRGTPTCRRSVPSQLQRTQTLQPNEECADGRTGLAAYRSDSGGRSLAARM